MILGKLPDELCDATPDFSSVAYCFYGKSIIFFGTLSHKP